MFLCRSEMEILIQNEHSHSVPVTKITRKCIFLRAEGEKCGFCKCQSGILRLFTS